MTAPADPADPVDPADPADPADPVTSPRTSSPHVAPPARSSPDGTDEAPTLPAPGELEDLLRIPPVARALWLRVLLAVGGLLFVALGVVGWLVPVISGIPFYLVGFLLLGMSHPPLGHWLNRKERRLPPRVRLALRPRVRAAWKRGEVRFGHDAQDDPAGAGGGAAGADDANRPDAAADRGAPGRDGPRDDAVPGAAPSVRRRDPGSA